ncbi:hypothetical protein MTO96_032673 [Rhipicephalus appendiculatus]
MDGFLAKYLAMGLASALASSITTPDVRHRTCARRASSIGEYLKVEDMDGFLGKCLLMGLTTAFGILTLVPHSAVGVPPHVIGTTIETIMDAFGRTEENFEE